MFNRSVPSNDSSLICLTVADMTRHHCISRIIDNSWPCNGWWTWCSVLRRVTNCWFIIIIIIKLIARQHWHYLVLCEQSSAVLQHTLTLACCRLGNNNNNNNNTWDNVYGAVIMTRVFARIHPVHLTNAGQRQAAADPQTRPTDLSCESAWRLLWPTYTIANFHYSAGKPIFILQSHCGSQRLGERLIRRINYYYY